MIKTHTKNKEIQKKLKIQGQLNAAKLRKEYEEGTEEDDELLAVGKMNL